MFDLLRHLSHYYWCVRVRTYVCACVHDFHCTQQSATQFACDFRLCSTIHSVDNLFHFFFAFSYVRLTVFTLCVIYSAIILPTMISFFSYQIANVVFYGF